MNGVMRETHTTEVGVNGILLKYFIGMFSIPTAGNYVNAWCGGNLADCRAKDAFPGPNTTSIMDWESVSRIG